jgi:hypothetical protein
VRAQVRAGAGELDLARPRGGGAQRRQRVAPGHDEARAGHAGAKAGHDAPDKPHGGVVVGAIGHHAAEDHDRAVAGGRPPRPVARVDPVGHDDAVRCGEGRAVARRREHEVRRAGHEPPLDARDLGLARGQQRPLPPRGDGQLAAEAQRRGIADVDDERHALDGVEGREGVLAAEQHDVGRAGGQALGHGGAQVARGAAQAHGAARPPAPGRAAVAEDVQADHEGREGRPRLARHLPAASQREVRDLVLGGQAAQEVEVAQVAAGQRVGHLGGDVEDPHVCSTAWRQSSR